MLFYILLGVVTILAIWSLIYWISEWQTGLGMAFFILIFIFGFSFAGILSYAIASGNPESTRSVVAERVELQALALNSGVEGSFFLGSGTVDEKQVISYLAQTTDTSGTYVTVENVEVDATRIFEDEDARPYMETIVLRGTNTAIFPWEVGISTTYNFHVPENSVVEDYTVDVG